MDFGLLQTIGVDEREVMARFMNNEGLYCRILKKFMEDKSYDELKISWEEGDYEAAFRWAHTLKGVSAITEQLRPGHTRDDILLKDNMSQLAEQYAAAQEVIEKL